MSSSYNKILLTPNFPIPAICMYRPSVASNFKHTEKFRLTPKQSIEDPLGADASEDDQLPLIMRRFFIVLTNLNASLLSK